MREVILKELWAQGFERKSKEHYPRKLYEEEGDRIKIEIIPHKDVYLEDLILGLRKFFDFDVLLRGDFNIDLERVHKEDSERKEILFLHKKEKIFEGSVGLDYEEKREVLYGWFYPEKFPRLRKVYVIVKEDSLKDYYHIINLIRGKSQVIVDMKRSFEKVKEISRDLDLDYIFLLDRLTLLDGTAIVYDVKMQREKRRKLLEVLR